MRGSSVINRYLKLLRCIISVITRVFESVLEEVSLKQSKKEPQTSEALSGQRLRGSIDQK